MAETRSTAQTGASVVQGLLRITIMAPAEPDTPVRHVLRTRVLLAEEPVTRRLLEAQMTRFGFDVVSVNDGLSAWEVLQSPNAPSLVVLDWNMPGLDGPDVCRKIRDSVRSGSGCAPPTRPTTPAPGLWNTCSTCSPGGPLRTETLQASVSVPLPLPLPLQARPRAL